MELVTDQKTKLRGKSTHVVLWDDAADFSQTRSQNDKTTNGIVLHQTAVRGGKTVRLLREMQAHKRAEVEQMNVEVEASWHPLTDSEVNQAYATVHPDPLLMHRQSHGSRPNDPGFFMGIDPAFGPSRTASVVVDQDGKVVQMLNDLLSGKKQDDEHLFHVLNARVGKNIHMFKALPGRLSDSDDES